MVNSWTAHDDDLIRTLNEAHPTATLAKLTDLFSRQANNPYRTQGAVAQRIGILGSKPHRSAPRAAGPPPAQLTATKLRPRGRVSPTPVPASDDVEEKEEQEEEEEEEEGADEAGSVAEAGSDIGSSDDEVVVVAAVPANAPTDPTPSSSTAPTSATPAQVTSPAVPTLKRKADAAMLPDDASSTFSAATSTPSAPGHAPAPGPATTSVPRAMNDAARARAADHELTLKRHLAYSTKLIKLQEGMMARGG